MEVEDTQKELVFEFSPSLGLATCSAILSGRDSATEYLGLLTALPVS